MIERNDMLSAVRWEKYRKIKQGPKMLNFGASKPGVKGLPGSAPGLVIKP